MIQFKETKSRVPIAGAQLSDGKLRAPFVLQGYPLQVREVDLPPGRIGLIIGNALWPRHPRLTPLPLPRFDRRNRWWEVYGYNDTLESLWFKVHGIRYIATVTFDNGAGRANLAAAARIVHSLHVVSARH